MNEKKGRPAANKNIKTKYKSEPRKHATLERYQAHRLATANYCLPKCIMPVCNCVITIDVISRCSHGGEDLFVSLRVAMNAAIVGIGYRTAIVSVRIEMDLGHDDK